MWILWELSIANAIFMRADLCEYEFYESWALWMWISWELSFSSVHVMSARLCILWVLSFYILPEDQCVVASEVKNNKGWVGLKLKNEVKRWSLWCKIMSVMEILKINEWNQILVKTSDGMKFPGELQSEIKRWNLWCKLQMRWKLKWLPFNVKMECVVQTADEMKTEW